MKNKLYIFFVFIIFCSFQINQELSRFVKQKDDKIFWNKEKKLSWNDFLGKPDEDENSLIGAKTFASIEIDSFYYENNLPKYRLKCYFIKNKSWTIVNDKFSLAHEQLHFDIAELFTRKIRKSFDSLNVKNNRNNKDYEKIYLLFEKNYIEYQDLYDTQVYFNERRQLQWERKISIELMRLKKYEYKE